MLYTGYINKSCCLGHIQLLHKILYEVGFLYQHVALERRFQKVYRTEDYYVPGNSVEWSDDECCAV